MASAVGRNSRRLSGLVAAPTPDHALLNGLSDRLGWEALRAWEQGTDLPIGR
jgi:hypothetical protein